MGAVADAVLEELLALRRSSVAHFIDLRKAPHLLWYCGRGSIDTTLGFLGALKIVQDYDIQAALAMLGMDGSDMNREDQLNAFAIKHGEVSSRTVRRWAEDGFPKIAQLVEEWSEEEGTDRPRVEVLVFQLEPGNVELSVYTRRPIGSLMFEPVMYMNYEEVDLHPQRVPSADGAIWEDVRGWAHIPLDATESAQAIVDFAWLGNVPAYFEICCHPTLAIAVTSQVTKKGCALSFWGAAAISVDGERGMETW